MVEGPKRPRSPKYNFQGIINAPTWSNGFCCEGPFTSCLKDVHSSIAMTVGWQFTGSAFTLEVRKQCFRHLSFQKKLYLTFRYMGVGCPYCSHNRLSSIIPFKELTQGIQHTLPPLFFHTPFLHQIFSISIFLGSEVCIFLDKEIGKQHVLYFGAMKKLRILDFCARKVYLDNSFSS